MLSLRSLTSVRAWTLALGLLGVGRALGATPAATAPAPTAAAAPAPTAAAAPAPTAAAAPAPTAAAAPAPTAAAAPAPTAAAAPAPAQQLGSAATPTDAEVDEHIAQGHRLYQLGRYQEAIAEYRHAYELRADPQFLFQIAESYRQLGATEQALFYYDRYLASGSDALDRDAAEARVGELESLRARPSTPATPGLTAPPGGAGKKQARQPWRRWWFWTAVGVALTAGVTAVALTGRSEKPIPATDLGDMKFFSP